MRRLPGMMTAATLILSALATAAPSRPAAPADAKTITTQWSRDHGMYLTDGDGRALYLFTADTQGASACYGACELAWPPFLSAEQPVGEGGVDKAAIGVIRRTDGRQQATYRGWPLYYFASDKAAGQTEGHEHNGYGGDWYLAAPEESQRIRR